MKGSFSRLAFSLTLLSLMTQQSIPQWVRTNSPSGEYVFSLAVSDTDLFAGTYAGGGVLLSTDKGTNWTLVDNLPDNSVSSLAISGQNLFAGTDGGVLLSTNSGTSWTAVNNGLTYPGVTSLAVSGTSIFAGTYAALFRSTDQGIHWVNVDSFNYIYSLYASGTDIFAGTDQGVLLSTDNGTNWTPVNNGLASAPVQSLISSYTNLFAAPRENGVYVSTDNGTNWTAVNDGLTHPNVFGFAVSGSNLFAGTYGGGIYLSTNNGRNWTAVNDGLTQTVVNCLAVLGTDLFIGTTDGVWRRPLSDMPTSVDRTISTPIHFGLEQNYPNPFNPATIISYQLATTTHVALKIYDILGREVSSLVDERENAGEHSVTFNATNLPSGVYFYRLQAGTFMETRKLTVLK